MFGMLDYRAHKLYLILFGVPLFLLSLITVFGLPLLSYGFGIKFSDVRIWQILISIALQFVFEILWTLFLTGAIAKLFNFVFSLFVDVIPSDGRTKAQAQQVVYSGSKAITIIDLDRIHPSMWSDELIEAIPQIDWVCNLFFREVMIRRFEMLRNYFSTHPDEPFSEYHVKELVKKSSTPITITEKLLTNKNYRRMLVLYLFFFYLLLFKPF